MACVARQSSAAAAGLTAPVSLAGLPNAFGSAICKPLEAVLNDQVRPPEALGLFCRRDQVLPLVNSL
jgi:hypothetical protein